MDNEIYTLEVHEELAIAPGIHVLRVPGGWVYTQYTHDQGGKATRLTSTFVPYNNEFQETTNDKRT